MALIQNVQAPSLLFVEQSSSPDNPDTDNRKVYFKDDGKLYQLDSSGTETEVGGSSGGGGVTDITYANLVTAIGASTLTAGQLYRITDFATVHYIVDGNSTRYSGAGNEITGTTEPLTVLALSTSTISHEAKSALYPQDIIHYDWNPANWMDDLSFADPDSEPVTAIITGFKGVITFRHDTLQDNYTGYDFRNVRFRRWKTNAVAWNSGTTYAKGAKATSGGYIYYSTTDANINNLVSTSYWIQMIDLSYTEYWFTTPQGASDSSDLLTFHECNVDSLYEDSAVGNHIEGYKDTYYNWNANATLLSNNVFHLEIVDHWTTASNVIEMGSNNNTIGANCYNNTIGANFNNNTIGASFNNNTIGASFNGNTIGAPCYGNTIGAGFNGNTIGSSFYSNTIEANFNNNTIGANCYNNTIGANCYNNTIGANFYFNTIGSGFYGNTIGTDFARNTIGASFMYNRIEDGLYGITSAGINFTSATHVYASYNCTIYIRPDGTGQLRYYNNSNVLVVVAANA